MPKVVYHGDASAAIKASQDLQAAQDRLKKGADDTTNAYGKADAAGRRWLRNSESAATKYNRQLAHGAELVKQGTITQREANKRVVELRAAYEKTDPAIRKTRAEQERLNALGGRIKSSLETPFDRYKKSVLEAGVALRATKITKAQFVAETRRAKQALADETGETKRLAAAERQAAQAADDLKRKALAIVRENETPLERFKRSYRELNKTYRKGAISLDTKRRAAANLKRELRAAGDAGRRTFSGEMITKVGGFTAGILSASHASAAVRKELELLRAEADRIAQTQITAAGAREKLVQNIAGLPKPQFDAFIQRAEKLTSQLGKPQEVIELALAEAYSGSGGNVEAAFRNVRTAALYNPNTPDAIAPTAGALSDVSKSTQDADALRNLGFLNKVGEASRVVDPEKQFKSIPQALGGLVTAEATPEESGALYAALSNKIPDSEGNLTTTAAINFGAKLEEFVDGQIKAGTVGAAIDTFGERLETVQGNRQLGKDFVDMMGGEVKARGALELLVTDPNSDVAQQYQRVKGSFGTAAEQRARGKSVIDVINQDRFSVAAQTNQVVVSGGDALRRVPLDPALGSDAHEELYRLNEQTDPDVRITKYGMTSEFLPRRYSRMGLYSRVGPEITRSEAMQQLQNRIAELEAIQADETPAGRGVYGKFKANRYLQRENPEFAAETAAMLVELKAMNANLERLQEQNESLRPTAGRQE